MTTYRDKALTNESSVAGRTEGVPRIRPLHPGDFTDDQKVLYDAITGGSRADGPEYFPLTDTEGRLHGPFDAMLRAPRVGQALQELGSTLRYATDLTDRLREMVILVIAAAEDSPFERFAHESVGRGVGLTEQEICAIRAASTPPLSDPVEDTVLKVVRVLLDKGDLTDDTYSELVAAVGERGVFELTTLIGYYRTLALQLRVFRVPIPDGS